MTTTLSRIVAHQRLRAACMVILAAGGVATAATPLPDGGMQANTTHGCVGRFDPAADYFPAKTSTVDATLFEVEYHKAYKVVSVKAGLTGGGARYLLVQCGTPTPTLDDQPPGTQVVMVPAESMFVSSPTHLPALVDLGRLEVLTGVSRLSDLPEPKMPGITAGSIRAFATSSIVDSELIVSSRPSLLMTAAAPNASLSVVRDAGVPIVFNAEWLEPTALGRAEWLKFIALFLNEERQAEELHGAMTSRYRALRDRAASRPDAERPLVMTGRSTRGVFTIAGGRSYVAGLIKDAGGRYVWADNTATGPTTVDIESQFGRAANADLWINGGGWKNHAAMLDNEPRYAAFKAYRNRQVWVYERRMTPAGGNDYWSRGVTHPDVLLADLIKIIHPELAADHTFEWYMKVPG